MVSVPPMVREIIRNIDNARFDRAHFQSFGDSSLVFEAVYYVDSNDYNIYMDVQEAKLREELQGTGVQVIREGDNIRLIMPGNITFPTDSYNLRSDFYPVLNSVGIVLAKYADTTLRVTGHTDNTGAKSYNQTLSEQRAQSVAAYLVTREVARQRMLVEGMGFSQPIADNGTTEGRAMNRRTELYILPKTA